MSEELIRKIYESLGTASMCWSETPKGVFESTRAKELGDALVDAIKIELESLLCSIREELYDTKKALEEAYLERDELKRENERLRKDYRDKPV